MDDVATPSGSWLRMRPRWEKIEALLGGTEAMRAAGHRFLPRYAAEEEAAWQVRRERAVLTNFFSHALRALASRPFARPIMMGEDMPAPIRSWAEDIDLRGNHLHVFAREVFHEGLAKGFTHMLIDFPRVAGGRTLADEQAGRARPYFVHVPPERVIAAHAEVVDGVERLTHVRLRETITRRQGFGERTIERIRVLEPGRYELHELRQRRWTRVEEGEMSLPVVPLVTFHAARDGFMEAVPPLTDLADKQIEHWQSASDQRNVLTVARFPMLAAAGFDEQVDQLEVGPNKLLTTRSAEGRFYYVEHAGAAIAAGRQDLEDLKEEMMTLALEPLTPRSGDITATARAIDAAQANCALGAWALALQDALEQAVAVMAEWAGLPRGGSIRVDTGFGMNLRDASDLQALVQLRLAGELPRDAFLAELKRRAVLGEDFDIGNIEGAMQ